MRKNSCQLTESKEEEEIDKKVKESSPIASCSNESAIKDSKLMIQESDLEAEIPSPTKRQNFFSFFSRRATNANENPIDVEIKPKKSSGFRNIFFITSNSSSIEYQNEVDQKKKSKKKTIQHVLWQNLALVIWPAIDNLDEFLAEVKVSDDDCLPLREITGTSRSIRKIIFQQESAEVRL